MQIEDRIREIAKNLMQSEECRTSGLQREIRDLEAELAQKQAQLDAANLAHDRLTNYQVMIRGNYQCPQCWILNGVQSTLGPVGGGRRGEDTFRCSVCSLQFIVTFP